MAQVLDQRPDAHAASGAKVLALGAAQRATILAADAAEDGNEHIADKARRDLLVVAAHRHHGQAREANVAEDAGAVAAVEQHQGVLGTTRPQQRRQPHSVDGGHTCLKLQRSWVAIARWAAVPRVQEKQQLRSEHERHRGECV